MQLKINLENDFDVYTLHLILHHERITRVNDNEKHEGMIKLLTGTPLSNQTNIKKLIQNTTLNEKAKEQLNYEISLMDKNNKTIKIIDNIMNQLSPIVNDQLNKHNQETNT